MRLGGFGRGLKCGLECGLGSRLGWSVVAGSVLLMSQAAFGVTLSVSLKNYYAEYEIVRQCRELAQLSAAEAGAAGAAMTKIEAYYLKRDASLDTDSLLKQAVADKNDSFKIVGRSGTSGLRPYCRMSLNELLTKAREVAPEGSDRE